MIKVIIIVFVIIILYNQRSRAINIFYMLWQLIGDGSGKSQLSTVGDQLKLVVDIGLTVLTVAGGHRDIFGFVVIFSISSGGWLADILISFRVELPGMVYSY